MYVYIYIYVCIYVCTYIHKCVCKKTAANIKQADKEWRVEDRDREDCFKPIHRMEGVRGGVAGWVGLNEEVTSKSPCVADISTWERRMPDPLTTRVHSLSFFPLLFHPPTVLTGSTRPSTSSCVGFLFKHSDTHNTYENEEKKERERERERERRETYCNMDNDMLLPWSSFFILLEFMKLSSTLSWDSLFISTRPVWIHEVSLQNEWRPNCLGYLNCCCALGLAAWCSSNFSNIGVSFFFPIALY